MPAMLSFSLSLSLSFSRSLSPFLSFSFFLSPFPLTYAGFLLGANKEQYFIFIFFFCFKRRAVARHLIIIV